MAQITIIPKTITAALVAASATTYYTCPAGVKKGVIKGLSFTNTDTDAIAITVYAVPSGGTAAAANTLSSAHSIAAGETWQCTEAENKVLASSDFLQALASEASKVSIQGTILEMTY